MSTSQHTTTDVAESATRGAAAPLRAAVTTQGAVPPAPDAVTGASPDAARGLRQRVLRRLAGERGAATAEYAVATMAIVA